VERMVPRSLFEKFRDDSLKAVDVWKRLGKPAWFTRYTSAAVQDLQIAVCFYPGPPEAVAYLRDRGMLELLGKLVGLYEASREECLGKNLPVGNDVIRYNLFACTCWLMEADELARQWVELGCHPAVLKSLRRFGVVYAESHRAFIAKEPYALPQGKRWLGWERNLLRYAALAGAITRGEDVGPHVKEIKKHFDRRNRTYGATENYDHLDGCKLRPASFDLRLEGILSYKRRHYD